MSCDVTASDVDLAAVAKLLAEPSRAAMAVALLDGRSHPASDLARAAGVRPSTASEQLGQLVAGGLLQVERAGRHRYYRLAGPDVAHAVEALGSLAPARPVLSPRGARVSAALAYARTCYDHLAGRLGVALTDAMLAAGTLSVDLALTEPGRRRLSDAGIDLDALQARRRPLTRGCLDWTQRRPHLGGAVGAAICDRLLSDGALARAEDSRAVRLTDTGRRQLAEVFGCVLPEQPAA
jgi:DNA-binding transcriptional ArsR family regulator